MPGSESGDSTSIFQDGLRLPVVRVLHKNRLEDGVFQMILLNSRTPHGSGRGISRRSSARTGPESVGFKRFA